MKLDDAWFHDPAGLRGRAVEYDGYAAACRAGGDDQIGGAWESKARALRSRAGAIERLNEKDAAA